MADDKASLIVKQIEFYFSDANVARDVYMKQIIAQSPEGFVPLAVLVKFKRVKHIVGEDTPDDKATEVILDALEKGATHVVVDSTRQAVRRYAPLPSYLVFAIIHSIAISCGTVCGCLPRKEETPRRWLRTRRRRS